MISCLRFSLIILQSNKFVENLQTIENILKSFGYKTQMFSNYLMCNALYRNGNDVNSVVIYPSGIVKDFVVGETFNINELLLRVMGAKTQEEIDKYTKDNNIELASTNNIPKIKTPKTFDKSLLSYIDKTDNSYLIGRGISKETCELFETGFCGNVKGRLKNRIIFPVFNTKKTELIGFAGRAPNNDIKPKVIIFGSKSDFIYPSHLNDSIIEKCKSVILVESQIDVLYMWMHGIRNVLCLFGTELSYGILNYLLRKNVEKIIISTNNEESGIGNAASHKIVSRLKRYFDLKSTIIKLPYEKDFCEMDESSLQKWMDELQLQVGYKYFNYE